MQKMQITKSMILKFKERMQGQMCIERDFTYEKKDDKIEKNEHSSHKRKVREQNE